MSECLDCGAEILSAHTYCDTCISSHVVVQDIQDIFKRMRESMGVEGIDWAYDREWKYCPHCGERLA